MLNKKGQALVEYVLIVALITLVVIGAVKLLGGYLKDTITKTSCSVLDKQYIEGKKPGEAYCEGEKVE